MTDPILLELTTDIVRAHVGNNSIPSIKLPELIETVYNSLVNLDKETEARTERPSPAVPVRSSVKPDSIICLDCGAKLKTLKRHLGGEHSTTPDEYRARWDLPSDYPMLAPEYAARRKVLAIELGLGRKPSRKAGPRSQSSRLPLSVPITATSAGTAPEPKQNSRSKKVPPSK